MPDSFRPPKGASLILGLFAGEPDFKQVQGDLSEEFYDRALRTGPATARSWYWREALLNAWAFITRPQVINVLGSASLCVALFVLAQPLYFRWLRGELASVPRVPGLRFFLLTSFDIPLCLMLGAVTSRFLRGREPMLRLAFTGFYLARLGSLLYFRQYYTVWLQEPLRFLLDNFGLLLLITSFWVGSLWTERRSRRRSAALLAADRLL